MNRDYYFLGAVALAAGYLYLKKDAIAAAVDPSSDENLVYKAINQIGDIFNDGQDDDDFNLGAEIYDLFNSSSDDDGYSLAVMPENWTDD